MRHLLSFFKNCNIKPLQYLKMILRKLQRQLSSIYENGQEQKDDAQRQLIWNQLVPVFKRHFPIDTPGSSPSRTFEVPPPFHLGCTLLQIPQILCLFFFLGLAGAPRPPQPTSSQPFCAVPSSQLLPSIPLPSLGPSLVDLSPLTLWNNPAWGWTEPGLGVGTPRVSLIS